MRGRAAGGRGDAAIAELPLPPGRHRESASGGRTRLPAASRTALWDTMPDDALFASAGARRSGHARRRREGRPPHARRPQGAPGARRVRLAVAPLRPRPDATKERRAFPNFTPIPPSPMTQEARRFVSDLVWNDRNFTELFTAPYGYPNGDLARIYGVEPPANDFDRVPFPAELRTRRTARAGAVPDADRQARRNLAHRARPVCARTVPLPARGRSAARRQHQSAARHARPSR